MQKYGVVLCATSSVVSMGLFGEQLSIVVSMVLLLSNIHCCQHGVVLLAMSSVVSIMLFGEQYPV